MLTTQIALLFLLLITCIGAIALKRLRVPFTVGLVVIGLIAGWLGNQVPGLAILKQITLSHDLILFLFVPPLVFESALNMDSRMLARNLKPVAMLAVPGLLLSTVIIGFLLSWLTPLNLPQALLFGAMISTTDPVAVMTGNQRLDSSVVEECAQTYTSWSIAALGQIQAGTEYSAELIQACQQKLARRAIWASEKASLAQLIDEGVIAAAISDRVQEHSRIP